MTYTDEKIVAAILANRTHREAIQALGMQERYFYKRLQNESLQTKLKAAREKVAADALHKLELGLSEAADVLREVMNDGNVNAQTRIIAANSLIQNALRLREQIDLIPRIEALEHGQT